MSSGSANIERQGSRRISRFLSEARLGWVDARLMILMPGRERALRFLAVLLFAQRASYVVPAFVGMTTSAERYHSPALNITLLLLMLLWNVALGVGVWRRGWFSRADVMVDVTVAVVLLVVVNANIRTGYELSAANWAGKFALGTAALVGAVLALRAVFVALGVVLVTAVAAAAVQIGGLPPWESGFVNHVNSSIFFAFMLHFMRRFLCAQASAVDEATQRRLAAETATAAGAARFAERLHHYRRLHDTALATLTAIARGGLDHRTAEVRRRCAREADYIRQLLTEDQAESVTTLGATLAEVVADAGALDLRVHLRSVQIPGRLPRHVVEAIRDATREALNNVARHAGTREAWLTVDWHDDVLAVRVVDRGVGFDSERAGPGFGLRRSIEGRIREIGGELRLFSEPGHGTCVELFWSEHGPQHPDHDPEDPAEPSSDTVDLRTGTQVGGRLAAR
ncbi:sensor histidine kinase [Plantactinospora sonchi]|uniref:ATP-binding protein n=1 Tax=Plantactinospora sonchi TaxID=1544735 RepID=A0ABU7RRX1_9ACTN